MDKNAVSVICANSYCKEDVVDVQYNNISMIGSMFLSLSHCALDIFAIEKYVDHGGKYKLEMRANFNNNNNNNNNNNKIIDKNCCYF